MIVALREVGSVVDVVVEIPETVVGDWLPVFLTAVFAGKSGESFGATPSTIVARRRLGWGPGSSGVEGACRTRDAFGIDLRGPGAGPEAGADDDKADRFGVDFELMDDAARGDG